MSPGIPPSRTSRPAGTATAVIVAVALALALVASACSPGSTANGLDPDNATPATDLNSADIVLTSGLETVNSCDDLLDRLRTEGSERVGPYGFGNEGFGPIIALEDGVLEEDAVDEAATDAMADSGDVAESAGAPAANFSQRAGEEGEDFSGTNNQESSVDEADLVKTDGERLVVVTGNRLRVLDVSGDRPRVDSTIKLPDEVGGGELFLDGDSALLMSSGWTNVPFMPVDGARSADLSWYPGMPTGRLMEIDLDEGRIVRTLEFEGSYLSAREVEGTIRIALQASANRFAFVFPSNRNAEESAEAFNRQLIEESTIDQWIPTYRIVEGSNGDSIDQGPIVDCDRVHLPAEFAGFGSLVVLTTDLDRGLELSDAVSVFTDAQTVYASTDRLVVATPRWPEFDPETGEPRADDNYRTALHTFDITDPRKADYVASGSVRGTLLSRYSLSEYGGHLRVATTDGTPWNTVDSESFLTVLDERDRDLVEIGQVGGLGRGERIFAVRFLGDLAYVVTFRQIDPLYVIDLSEPDDPEVRGELKIPGFSNYLHPLDDGLLLAVGVDGDEEGNTGGSVASLFDVSDLDDPRLVDKMPLARFVVNDDHGDFFSHSYSPVDNDPRAFTWFDDTAIIPVAWWRSQESENQFLEIGGTEAVMIQVDDDRLVEIDRVSHPMERQCEGSDRPVKDYIELDDLEAMLAAGTVNDLDGGTTTGGLDPDDRDLDDDDRDLDDDDRDGEDDGGDAEASFVDPPAEEEPIIAEEEILPRSEQFCWFHSPEIMRTVVVGDNLYTVAHNGIGVHDFDRGSRIDWIPFDGP